jgi:hypothetical protein
MLLLVLPYNFRIALQDKKLQQHGSLRVCGPQSLLAP